MADKTCKVIAAALRQDSDISPLLLFGFYLYMFAFGVIFVNIHDYEIFS